MCLLRQTDQTSVPRKQRPGDIFLLFKTLPYDFDEDLPLVIAPNTCLDNTPRDELSSAAPSSLADYVLPGYNLGYGANCCLRYSSAMPRTPDLEPMDILFLSIAALRLCKPLPIEVEGQFELGTDDDPIQKPGLFHLTSAWQPEQSNNFYSAEDIRHSADIVNRIMEIGRLNFKGISSAIVQFSQTSCGLIRTYQMAYMSLFAALEALFVPKGNKSKTIAARISRFLSRFEFPEDIKAYVERVYKHGRSDLAHGVQDVVPWTKLRPSKEESFGRLHEITRLCVLGFFSLDNDKLKALSETKSSQKEKALDALGPADGQFLGGQRMWLSAEQ